MARPEKTAQLGALAFAAVLVCSIGVRSGAGAFASETVVPASSGDFTLGADAASTRPAATFFTISAVLAKFDRQRGRGPGALRQASLAPSEIATDVAPAQTEAPAAGPEPFGLFPFRAPEGALWRKWRGVESDISKEQAVLVRCRESANDCPAPAAQFLRLINAVQARSGRDQLDEANRAVNTSIRYVTDYAQLGEADRWSTPLATFATAKGDCEDYAIAKYVALREAGFPEADLRLVLVRDRALHQDHAVLAAHLEDGWLILDNRSSELYADADAAGITPLFVINHLGVKILAAPYAERPPLDREIDAAPAAARLDGEERDESD